MNQVQFVICYEFGTFEETLCVKTHDQAYPCDVIDSRTIETPTLLDACGETNGCIYDWF